MVKAAKETARAEKVVVRACGERERVVVGSPQVKVIPQGNQLEAVLPIRTNIQLSQ